MYDLRQEHVCLFEKMSFEINVDKKKETSIKLLCYKKEKHCVIQYNKSTLE